jgi:hypothetical protein
MIQAIRTIERKISTAIRHFSIRLDLLRRISRSVTVFILFAIIKPLLRIHP